MILNLIISSDFLLAKEIIMILIENNLKNKILELHLKTYDYFHNRNETFYSKQLQYNFKYDIIDN